MKTGSPSPHTEDRAVMDGSTFFVMVESLRAEKKSCARHVLGIVSMKCINTITTLLFSLLLIGLFSCNSSPSQSGSASGEELSKKESSKKKLSQEELFSTESRIRENIENTIWTYTKPGDYWKRIEFKNGKAYFSTAWPASGAWGEKEVYNYTIVERRYSDTGKRCMVIEMTEPGEEFCFLKLVPATGQCNWLRETFMMNLGDYFWD